MKQKHYTSLLLFVNATFFLQLTIEHLLIVLR